MNKLPIYLKIYNDLKEKIEKNEFSKSTKLPSIRQLAIKYNVNNLTVIKAYNILEKENYIIKKQGIGIFIKNNEPLFYRDSKKELINSFNKNMEKENEIINFISGTPSYEIYPFEDLKNVIENIFINEGPKIMSYSPTKGIKKLRYKIKKILENDSIFISSKNIQIINGAQQGLDLILKGILSKRKNKIVLGNLTYHGALSTFKDHCQIFQVPMEKDGFNMEILEDILSKEKISFIYTTMDFSCPTGISWSKNKRIQLINLAKKYNVYIVEDDFSSDLSFNYKKEISLKTLDKENKNVIYIKSYSKILMPGLRLAFMICPDKIVDKIINSKFASDIASPSLEQYILLEFLNKNFIDKNVDKLRNIYKKRYEFLVEELKNIKELEISYPINGGFYIWLKLNKSLDSDKFYLNCKREKVFLLRGNEFSLNNKNNNFFRLSFATTNEEQIKKGIDKIKYILK